MFNNNITQNKPYYHLLHEYKKQNTVSLRNIALQMDWPLIRVYRVFQGKCICDTGTYEKIIKAIDALNTHTRIFCTHELLFLKHNYSLTYEDIAKQAGMNVTKVYCIITQRRRAYNSDITSIRMAIIALYQKRRQLVTSLIRDLKKTRYYKSSAQLIDLKKACGIRFADIYKCVHFTYGRVTRAIYGCGKYHHEVFTSILAKIKQWWHTIDGRALTVKKNIPTTSHTTCIDLSHLSTVPLYQNDAATFCTRSLRNVAA